jgi:fermentation-respiration switch protein FrsA (DUF1100 family)
MSNRYATNAFTNFADFEKGVFKANEVDDVMAGDNPEFLYPSKILRNAPTGTTQKIQRGYMRMLSQGFKGGSSLARRRLHFQFNPDSIVRHVQARNDVQLWMNQDPVQLMQPIPGDANFAFELLFNREAEVSSGTYRDGPGEPKPSTGKAQLPLGQAGTNNKKGSADIPHSAVTDIGVLADLMVLDDIIGQGINTQLIEKVITNANAINAKQRKDAARNGSTGNNPSTSAQATVTLESNKIKTVTITNGGSGYTSSPKITLSGGGGSGAKLTAVIANGAVTSVTIDEAGTGYTSVPGVTFTGGGDGSGTSADGTSDAQDIPEEFDVADAQKALYNNFGNSAFLVSLPVRIVFSSLFMVEGYITSTTVTFNKFNANMVPTQCSVGIQMQALYIGFARKDTFLTLTLKEGLDAAQAALEASGGQDSDPEIAAAESIGKALFEKTVRQGSTTSAWSPDESNESREIISPNQIFERKDYVQTIAVKVKATKDLKALLGRNSIKDITQKGSWKITYLGNTNTATPLGNSTGIVKDEVLTEMFKEGTFNKGDLKDKDGDTIKLQFESTPLAVGKKVDTTSTSRYKVEFRINFELITESGETVPCKQVLICTGIVSFSQQLHVSRKGSMITQLEPWDWKSTQ